VLPSILQCFADRHPRVDLDVVIASSAWVAQRVARQLLRERHGLHGSFRAADQDGRSPT
jgi:hypothetical protein